MQNHEDFTIQPKAGAEPQEDKAKEPEELSETDRKKILDDKKLKRRRPGVLQTVKKGAAANYDQVLIIAFAAMCSIFGGTAHAAASCVLAGDFGNGLILGCISIGVVFVAGGLYIISLFFPEGELTENMQRKLIEYLRSKQKSGNWADQIFKSIMPGDKT